MNNSPGGRQSPLGLFPGHRAPRAGPEFAARSMGCESKGVMLILIRRRDHKYEKAHMAEPEGIVAVVCADSTACYKGQKLEFRILCGSI